MERNDTIYAKVESEDGLYDWESEKIRFREA